MQLIDLSLWLEERKLDLHWSHTSDGEVCLTAIRGKAIWNGTAASVADAMELLKLSVESSWGATSLAS